MEIMLLPFESRLLIHTGDETAFLTAFKTVEEGNIKMGITAPSCIRVNREEIFLKKKQQLKEE